MGARIVLEFPSHTATDNLLMAAVLAKGTTVIENAAREPEVADLAAMLNRMGANVVGAGTSTIEVQGVDELHAVEHTVIPDRIEAATWVAAVGIAGGEVTIEGARSDHMDMVIQKMADMGVRVSPSSSGLWASSSGRLRSTDVATLPYPGIATDYKPMLVAMLAVADGVGHRHREHLPRQPVRLRRRAQPHGRRHPHRGAPRRGAGRRPRCRAPRSRPTTCAPASR